MLMYLTVMVAALAVAALTLISGFGIGTLLMPVFAIFFPIEAAVAMTAVVHLSNNLFKTALVGKHADWSIALRFIIPGLLFSAFGAYLLTRMAVSEPVYSYEFYGARDMTLIKLVIAALMLLFAILEFSKRFEGLAFPKKYIPLGGALSGFFGGLSGHQGALRSAFLIRSIDDKAKFIGTGVVCSVVVDLSRVAVYGTLFFGGTLTTIVDSGGLNLISAAVLTAFLGSFIGNRFMKKVKMRHVRNLVGWMLLTVALLLGSGMI
ncbi:sulfite exporter TauE/SafE family protein [Candidatus Marinimicrobia bacterium MT.SAG.2]|nr:sulfite exporter TauE/SafE family protein [Candidatus Marinimicrobia bacterium MT.SAG.2]